MKPGKICVVTGICAAEIVKAQIKNIYGVIVQVLPVSVAAFISPKLISEHRQRFVGSDLVMVPGMAYGDFSRISKTLNLEIVKGPRYAFDLPEVLNHVLLGDIKLSSKKAADLVMEDLKKETFEHFFDTFKKEIRKINDHTFYLGTSDICIPVGVGFPPVIVAEITDALELPIQKVLARAVRYVRAGAKIIDIGALVGEEHPKEIGKIVTTVRDRLESLDALVSIDSIHPSEIEAGVDAGAELVFSIDGRNMEAVVSACKEVGVIVLPTDKQAGNVPADPRSRVKQLHCNIIAARQLGYKKIVGDLILESMIYPGLLNSLTAYSTFRREHPLVPLCMGIGNVTEFADFDSGGINGVMTSLGIELDINIFLTTEASIKTRNTIFETAHSAKMAFFAKQRNMPPKDLGIDLLIAKSKRRKDIEGLIGEKIDRIEVQKKRKFTERDKKGYFRIFLDYNDKAIIVEHFSKSGRRGLGFKGKKAQEICLEILERKLVDNYKHACYLGSELKKAEVYLSLGKEYYQDEDPFTTG
ncbi:MAG: dihydropteroate synthase-like protein [Candidatus Heimdallarchaeota archaeon]